MEKHSFCSLRSWWRLDSSLKWEESVVSGRKPEKKLYIGVKSKFKGNNENKSLLEGYLKKNLKAKS